MSHFKLICNFLVVEVICGKLMRLYVILSNIAMFHLVYFMKLNVFRTIAETSPFYTEIA